MNGSFKERYDDPDIAQGEAKKYLAEKGFDVVEFGMRHTPEGFPYYKLNTLIRTMPDLIAANKETARLVECKGFNGTLKLKLSDIAGYEFWNGIMPVVFFLFDMNTTKHTILTFTDLRRKLFKCPISNYEDNGLAYFQINQI